MATTCSSCNSAIKLDDRYCGECGAPVELAPEPEPQVVAQEEATQPEPTAESSDPPPVSDTGTSSGMSVSTMTMIALGAAAVLAVVFSMSKNSSQGTNTTRSSPVTSAPSGGVSAARPTQPSVPPASSQDAAHSGTVDDYVARVRKAYKSHGIDQIATSQFTVASCGPCVPYLIYCIPGWSGKSPLKGRKVRISTKESREFARVAGAEPVQLLLDLVRPALEKGIIQCSISGGAVPK